jgi:Domain of Unknown Function (DUF1206)
MTEHVSQSRWIERSGRFGLATKGVSYLLVAALALKVAAGGGGETEDQQGALQAVADEPLGWALILLVALGFGCHAVWCFVQAVVDREDKGDDAEGLASRLADAGEGILYAGLAIVAFVILAGAGGNSSRKEDKATATVLDLPLGRWLVGLGGLVIVGIAVYNAHRAVTGSFREELREEAMHGAARPWYVAFGVIGHLARAVVFGLIGFFLLRAAWQYDPDEAIGLDEALRKLAGGPYGPVLLGAIATGLAAYGLFCLVQAKYRDV